MDLATAEIHRNRLQKELDAIRDNPTGFSSAPKILALEVDRLNQQIASAESLRALAGGSEVKIAVENDMMLIQLSRDVGLRLKDKASLEIFQAEQLTELAIINRFHQPLPFTYQLTQRVVELLEEELIRLERKTRAESSPKHSRFYEEELNKSIKDVINTVIEKNEAGSSAHDAIKILKENNSIVVDDHVRCIVTKKYFEATFPLENKPAPLE